MRFTWKSVSDVLSDKELKNTLGGYGGGYGTCCWKGPEGSDGISSCDCGATKDQAIFMAVCKNTYGLGTDCAGNWCCDSCGSSTWAADCGY